jgi:hypothetical protein
MLDIEIQDMRHIISQKEELIKLEAVCIRLYNPIIKSNL